MSYVLKKTGEEATAHNHLVVKAVEMTDGEYPDILIDFLNLRNDEWSVKRSDTTILQTQRLYSN